jgi:hypothetical protein
MHSQALRACKGQHPLLGKENNQQEPLSRQSVTRISIHDRTKLLAPAQGFVEFKDTLSSPRQQRRTNPFFRPRPFGDRDDDKTPVSLPKRQSTVLPRSQHMIRKSLFGDYLRDSSGLVHDLHRAFAKLFVGELSEGRLPRRAGRSDPGRHD